MTSTLAGRTKSVSSAVQLFLVLALILLTTPGKATVAVDIVPIISFLLDDIAAGKKVSPKLVTLNTELTRPWGMAFLPDSRILVTQKTGSMVILNAEGDKVSAVITGLPPVLRDVQGGLLDVALDPNFEADPWLYWTFADEEAGQKADLAGTAVARGRLVGTELKNVSVIYRQFPKVSGTGHYGARLAFAPDKTLFVTLGERQKGNAAQDLATIWERSFEFTGMEMFLTTTPLFLVLAQKYGV